MPAVCKHLHTVLLDASGSPVGWKSHLYFTDEKTETEMRTVTGLRVLHAVRERPGVRM